MLLFKVQKLQTVTVSLLGASTTLPVSVLLTGVYIPGMVTGGSIVSVLKRWVAGAKPPR